MPNLSGISNAEAVRVFGKVGFRIARQGKHTIMSNGKVRLTIPRHDSPPQSGQRVHDGGYRARRGVDAATISGIPLTG